MNNIVWDETTMFLFGLLAMGIIGFLTGVRVTLMELKQMERDGDDL